MHKLPACWAAVSVVDQQVHPTRPWGWAWGLAILLAVEATGFMQPHYQNHIQMQDTYKDRKQQLLQSTEVLIKFKMLYSSV